MCRYIMWSLGSPIGIDQGARSLVESIVPASCPTRSGRRRTTGVDVELAEATVDSHRQMILNNMRDARAGGLDFANKQIQAKIAIAIMRTTTPAVYESHGMLRGFVKDAIPVIEAFVVFFLANRGHAETQRTTFTLGCFFLLWAGVKNSVDSASRAHQRIKFYTLLLVTGGSSDIRSRVHSLRDVGLPIDVMNRRFGDRERDDEATRTDPFAEARWELSRWEDRRRWSTIWAAICLFFAVVGLVVVGNLPH